HQADVLVRGGAVVALKPALEAAMHEHVLPLRPCVGAHRLHRAAAVAGPVPRPRAVHVTRVEAERTVVAVMPAGGQGAYVHPAMAAAKLLAARARPGGRAPVSIRFGHGCFRLITTPRPSCRRRGYPLAIG